MSDNKKKIKFEDIILCTNNKDNRAVFRLLSAFLEPGANGTIPTGEFAHQYKWEPIEKWLTEQMGRDDIGARYIDLRGAKWFLLPHKLVSIPLNDAENDFQIKLQAIRIGMLRLPFSPDSGMAVIDFINPTSKKRSADLISQEELDNMLENPPQAKKGKQNHDKSNAPVDSGEGSSNSNAPVDSGEGSSNSNAPVDSGQGSSNSNAPVDKGKGKANYNAPVDSGEGSSNSNAPIDLGQDGSDSNEPIVLDDDEEDEENETDVNKAIVKAMGYYPKLETDKYWKEICIFFDRKPDDENEITIPGLLAPLLPHQASMVYWVLSRYTRGIVSAGMADEMGLGKTFTTIAIIMIYSHLHSAQVKVAKAHASNDRGARKQHCLPNAARGAQCPSQKDISRNHGIQCPCVPGSLSRFIIDNFECHPSLIIVPPNLLSSWVTEWKKFVAPPPVAAAPAAGEPNEEAPNLRLHVWHKDYQQGEDGYIRIVNSTSSSLAAHGQPHWIRVADTSGKKGAKSKEVLKVRRKGHANASNKVILTTIRMTSSIDDKFVSTATWEAPDTKNNPKQAKNHNSSCFACSLVFFDESHTIGPDTESWKLLKKLRLQNAGPTLAVGMSGSLLASKSGVWEGLLNHTFQWDRRARNGLAIGPMKLSNYLEHFDALARNWKFLQNNMLLEAPDIGRQTMIQNALADVKTVCVDGNKGIIGGMVVGRKKSDTFRNKNILGLEPVNLEMRKHTLPKGKTRDGIRRLCRGVRALLHAKYAADKEKWDKDHRGREPSETDKGYEFLRNHAQFSSVRQASSGKAYFRLHQCAVFPYLTRLYHRLENKVLTSEEIGSKYASPFTKEVSLRDRTRNHLEPKLQLSPYWEHRENLVYHSPKFQTLMAIIQYLIGLKRKPQEQQPDKGPADGSNVRNLVVFTESPLSAYLTAMLLVHRMGDDVEPLLIHSHLPEVSNKTFPNHSRAAFKQYFDADCRKGARNKILIGTYELLATGHNLQARTNHVVLMDVATETNRTQAITRFQRLGQRLPVTVYQLWDTRNLFEAHRMIHIGEFKKHLPKAAFDRHEYVNWKYYTDKKDREDMSASTDGRGDLTPVPQVEDWSTEASEAEEPIHSSSPFPPRDQSPDSPDLRPRREEDFDEFDSDYGEEV